MSKINSHNEWDTLKECILGTAQNTHATFTWANNTEIDQKKLYLHLLKLDQFGYCLIE